MSGTINADHGYIVKDTAVMPAGAYVRVRAKCGTPSAATLTRIRGGLCRSHYFYLRSTSTAVASRTKVDPFFQFSPILAAFDVCLALTTDHMFADS